jgi:hypothetical protein
MMLNETPPNSSRSRSRANLVFLGFLLIAGFYLISEHRAHLFGWLPLGLLLLCPLMHVFMHGGHGGHGQHGGRDQQGKPSAGPQGPDVDGDGPTQLPSRSSHQH